MGSDRQQTFGGECALCAMDMDCELHARPIEQTLPIIAGHTPCMHYRRNCVCQSCKLYGTLAQGAEAERARIMADLKELHATDWSPTRRATYIALASRWSGDHA